MECCHIERVTDLWPHHGGLATTMVFKAISEVICVAGRKENTMGSGAIQIAVDFTKCWNTSIYSGRTKMSGSEVISELIQSVH